MYYILPSVLLVLLTNRESYGHKYNLGSCPDIAPLPDFNMNDYIGLWYVIEKPTTLRQSCVMYNISQGEEPNTFEMTSIIPHSSLPGLHHEHRSDGHLTIPDPSIPGIMKLDTSLSAYTFTVFMGDLGYFAFYTCKKWPVGHIWSAEIISRIPILDKSVVEEVHAKLISYNVKTFKMSTIDQDDCLAPGEKGAVARFFSDITG